LEEEIDLYKNLINDNNQNKKDKILFEEVNNEFRKEENININNIAIKECDNENIKLEM